MFDLRSETSLIPSKSSRKKPSAAEAPEASGTREAGALETTVKSVGRSMRFQLFRHQRHGAALLGKKHKIGLCKWSINDVSSGVSVRLKLHENGGQTAYYEGLQTCAAVWVCPCCGNRISSRRRDEMNRLLSWARAEGHSVFMVTLTARHGAEDDLSELLEAIKLAKKRLHQHRAWRRLKASIIGSVTATEVTHGRNGWHPHYHVILVVENDPQIEAQLRQIEQIWLASLAGAGLSGTGNGFDLRNASGTKSYIAKWGAAEEVTMNRHKKGRRSGRTPAQLLADSCDKGDKAAGALWVRFTEVFKGRRQLVWSRGLKAMAGIDEVEDEEAAQIEVEEPEIVAQISRGDWSGSAVAARRRRGAILDAAESGSVSVSEVVYDIDRTDADYERELAEYEAEAEAVGAVLDDANLAACHVAHGSVLSGERAQLSMKIGRGPEPQAPPLAEGVRRGPNRIFVDSEHDHIQR